MTTMDVTPLDAPLAATVRGWDPSRPLTDDESALLRDALARHHVLVLRGIQTDRGRASLRQHFGPLLLRARCTRASASSITSDAYSNESTKRVTSAGGRSGELAMAHRLQLLDAAGKESFLERWCCLPVGSNTMFCDLYAPYDACPTRRTRCMVCGRITPHGCVGLFAAGMRCRRS